MLTADAHLGAMPILAGLLLITASATHAHAHSHNETPVPTEPANGPAEEVRFEALPPDGAPVDAEGEGAEEVQKLRRSGRYDRRCFFTPVNCVVYLREEERLLAARGGAVPRSRHTNQAQRQIASASAQLAHSRHGASGLSARRSIKEQRRPRPKSTVQAPSSRLRRLLLRF